MIRRPVRLLAFAVCLAGISRFGITAENPTSDPNAIEGLWSGSWGLYITPDGVVHQPVKAELFIEGDHVELTGFPDEGSLAGTIRIEASAKQMRVIPASQSGGQPAKAITYKYEIKGDDLVLIDSTKHSIQFHRHPLARNPLANAQVELVAATGMNDAGDLLVTEFTRLPASRTGTPLFEPKSRSLKIKQATILLVDETRLKKATVGEARRLLRDSTPVVIAYRPDDRPPSSSDQLGQATDAPMPDSEAVGRTFSRVLRPGTLVFILSARENAPVP